MVVELILKSPFSLREKVRMRAFFIYILSQTLSFQRRGNFH